MAYINIFLSRPARLAIKNSQLNIDIENKIYTYPLEDINSIMVESGEIIFSSNLISSLADSGAVVFFCGYNHMPNAVTLPYKSYYKSYYVEKQQLSIPRPLVKQLWQSIVRCKITNQSKVLDYCGMSDQAERLVSMSKAVSSNDSDNMEARAASYYFPILFGEDFVRREDNIVNACLNYGYAILRGIIARTLVAYGFNSSWGLHHENELNAFNLADDIIEVFRPAVDLIVYNLFPQGEKLTPLYKKTLYSVLNNDIQVEDAKYNITYAVELVVQSLLRSISDNANHLILPVLLPISNHSYE